MTRNKEPNTETENLKEYFSGRKLYGDDFDREQIKRWFEDEKEGYSELFSNYKDQGYDYHELNKIHGFNKIKSVKHFDRVLSIGGAKGDELLPIVQKVGNITIIEPSKKLRSKELQGKKITYLDPESSGKINLPSETIDLITCFGVLHHIPNVSFVFQEMTRVLKKGGYMLIREPIVSMGDWTKPRKGLTKRERGIPLNIFRDVIKKNNLKIVSEDKVLFPLTRRLKLKNGEMSNSKSVILLDHLLSRLFSWNSKYHSTKPWHKIRPQSVFYVLEKK